jgi:catechol 2,3-dioxygenase-like lactoylglutathione lyase family enzyme
MLLDHLSVQCADVAASAAFYDAVLAPLGAARVMDFGDVLGFGVPGRPTFWLGPLEFPDRPGPANRPSHVAFVAPSRAAVDAFYDAALGIGAESLHAPKLWPEYHSDYYAAFVRDLDGNNVEAVHHSPIDPLPAD